MIGLSLLLYPTFSNWWNSMHQSRAISSYSEAVSLVDPAVFEDARSAAQSYNASIPNDIARFKMSDEDREIYNRTLNLAGDGIMGILEIPSLHVQLPIYHGTSEAVLQVAIGHIEGSSLPIGGEGTHCALSGHRGLPSARLFTDLDQLVVGDTFLMHVLDETLTYEVDQIKDYLGKEGCNGIPSWYDIRDDIMRSFPNDDFDDEDFNYFYEEHREAWLSYRVEECNEE